MIKQKETQKGFALYFSIIIASIVIFIGIAVADISFQEVRLSQSGRQSQYAFYASNTGIECALYHDSTNASFPLDEDDVSDGKPLDITCTGHSENEISGGGTFGDIDNQEFLVEADSDSATTTFKLFNVNDSPAPESCVIVSVGKRVDSGVIKTTIESRGRDKCDGSRRTERAIRINY